MPSPFTFVNITDAPGLGPIQAKEMRGHVTKTNFARRRRKLAKVGRQDSNRNVTTSTVSSREKSRQDRMIRGDTAISSNYDMLPINSVVDPTLSSIAYLLYKFRPIVFPAGTGAPGSKREAEWVNLLQSEPALVEASISIAASHCPTQDSRAFRQAVIHKGRAMTLINQKLGTPSGLSDGVLSAVFTLTYAELLESNSKARSVHIDGLAQMIRIRRSTGNTAIPSWFCDFLLYDSIGNTILSARYANQPLIDALRNDDDPNRVDVAEIRYGICELCLIINKYHDSPIPQLDLALVISHEVERLRLKIDTLLGTQESYVRSLHDSLQLYLLLLWPTEEHDRLGLLAEDLKFALLQPHMRLCASMKVLVWQLFLGVAASEPLSEVRSWYITRLREVLSSMNIVGLDMAMETLTQAFPPDARLSNKFATVWQEVFET